MGKIARYPLVILFMTTLVWLTACERDLSGAEIAAVLAYSEPAMDNLFAGLKASDYAVFSRDFDSDMFEQVPASSFAAWKREVDSHFGRYLSRSVEGLKKSDEFFVVVYQASFERESHVTVRVAFHANRTIAFLGFEAERYSWSAWE